MKSRFFYLYYLPQCFTERVFKVLKVYLFPPSKWAIKLKKKKQVWDNYINGPNVDFRVQSTDVKLNTDICMC